MDAAPIAYESRKEDLMNKKSIRRIRLGHLKNEKFAPIAHTTNPQLQYNGGPVLANAEVFTIFWGGAWNNQPALANLSQSINYVGVPHGVELNGEELFFAHVHLHGGPAPVRRYLPKLIDQVWNGKINPGKVFDLTLPLDQVGEGYRAMDERRAIKTLLRP